MNTSIDYSFEKKGYVIAHEHTGEFFSTCDGIGWFRTTPNLGNAHFFTSKAKALAFAKTKDLAKRDWIVAPAKFIAFVEATKGVRISNGRAVSFRKR
ncbi:MAG: hypothetical protein ACI4CE_07410 [Methanomethylophilus alvi]